MPRLRSPRVAEIKSALVTRLRGELVHPGGRFLSTRALAAQFHVSYKTAHRLLGELRDEGLLARRAASGTYFAGEQTSLKGAQLIFHARAKRPDSFGGHLLGLLENALQARGIRATRSWIDDDRPITIRRDCFPVAWECRAAASAAAAARRFALCLTDTPPPGLGGGLVDAITTDDYSGGACAAELLKARTGRTGGFAVLSGPSDDPRSRGRIAGFCAQASNVRVIAADSWFLEAGQRHAGAILELQPCGIFACNDRLAEAILEYARKRRVVPPPLVGFDNAPVAARLRLTTIGIPWDSIVAHAVELIAARIAGNMSPAKIITLPHEPVIRLTA